jgi:hypothetical protein
MTDERGNSSDIKAHEPDLKALIRSMEDALKRMPERSSPHRQVQAVLQVLRGEPIQKMAELSGFSVRSIQRWRAKVLDRVRRRSRYLRVAGEGRVYRLNKCCG